nr:retrovirus-related Pol polyprotein from transposon TNT 1-94 [Tanacetum cinerariifolium]
LNAKTLNVKSVSMCDKCLLHDKHDMCVLKSVAKPIKRTVASESNKKPRNSTRKLYEHVSKKCSWWYPKFTPSGYIWKPKSRTENVNPNVSMPLGNKSRTDNILDTMTPRKSTCFIRDLKGNDLLSGSHGIDLYSITLQDTNSLNPICLAAKATSDGENLDKMKEKGDECIFVGYSNQLRAYKVFNKRTRVIMESIHVNFDELPLMASDQLSSDPAPECQTMALDQNSSDLAPE